MIVRDPLSDNEWCKPLSRWQNLCFVCLVPFALMFWAVSCIVLMGVGMTRLVLMSAEIAIRKRLTRA